MTRRLSWIGTAALALGITAVLCLVDPGAA
jgi:hypothetical protein